MSEFIRACIVHQLPLEDLDCPRGHRSVRFDDQERDDVAAWLVVHVASGRVAATVHGSRVTWEPWFEATFEDSGKLTGREEDGAAGRLRGARVPITNAERRRARSAEQKRLRRARAQAA